MSNKKQTAVEWLLKQLEHQVSDDGKQTMSLKVSGYLREQAKELEKQQHEETSTHMVNYAIHCISNLKESDFDKKFEQYYTETYGGNK